MLCASLVTSGATLLLLDKTLVASNGRQRSSDAWSGPQFDRTGGIAWSDRLAGQADCHGVLLRTMALRMPRRRRMQAIRATFLGRPRATSAS